MSILKKIIKRLLESEVFGRLSRKFVYVTIQVSERVNLSSVRLFHKLPYVKKLSRRITPYRVKAMANYYLDLHDRLPGYSYQPKISVIVPVYKTPIPFLKEMLLSIEGQIYQNWELCIVDDCSMQAEITKVIEDFSRKHPGKVKAGKTEKNSHISITSNECLKMATGEYVALLDHDDRLYPNSLAEMVRHINLNNKPEILYSDERVISEGGETFIGSPFFKPSWSPFFHLCVNYTTHLTVYKTDLVRAVGGFRAGFEGSQDHDLMLRMTEKAKTPVVHVPFCLYQWRAHAASTASDLDSKPYAVIAGEKAVAEAIARRGRPGVVTFDAATKHYRIKFEIAEKSLVSIIIPSKNGFNHISRCLESIFAKTTYQNFEVIISDNGTTDVNCLKLYDDYKKKFPDRFHFQIKVHQFNFGRQLNDGAKIAKGKYILPLNNDTEVITPEWIEEMLCLAQFPEVGAVGCKLLYPHNDTIQHAGLVTLGPLIASTIAHKVPRKSNMYVDYNNTIHECTAVTGACLLIEKKKYFEVGGHNEVEIANGFGDVDLCLKLRAKGYVCMFTPFAELYHFESPSRGESLERFEALYLKRKYASDLLTDPYASPNLMPDGGYLVPDKFANLTDLNNSELLFFLSRPIDSWKSEIAKIEVSN